MLMAAGLGTRLRPFTNLTAKPLLPLMGVPMSQFSLDLMKGAGVERVVANVHHLAEQTATALRFLDGPKDFIVSDERDLLMGSAGAMVKALPHFENQPFFYVNGDVLSNVNLRDLATHHAFLRHHYSVRLTLAVYLRSPDVGLYPEMLIDDKRSLVRGIGEKKQLRPFFGSVAVMEPECFIGIPEDQPSDFVEKILKPSIQMGRCGAYLIDNTLDIQPMTWFDIGSADLWYTTHLRLMDMYEKDELPTAWRNRILKHNRRLAPNVWVSNRSDIDKKPSGWSGPAYWSPDVGGVSPPATLGPGCVLYGAIAPGQVAARGIGYRQLWKPV